MKDMMYMPVAIKVPRIIERSFRDKTSKCIVVEVTGKEYQLCEERSHFFWSSTKGGYYGRGIINSAADKRKTERTGLLGQMAFGKVFQVPVDLVYRRGGDKYDVLLGTRTVDIKCASKCYGAMLVRHSNESGKLDRIDKDVFIGGYVSSEDRKAHKARVILVGYLLRDDIFQYGPRPARQGTHLNYDVPYEKLHAITRILNWWNKQRARMYQAHN